jgi:pimeloyl-ACP methyl ester carboxylesterase
MVTRRQFIPALSAAAGAALVGCKQHAANKRCPGPRSDFVKVPWIRSEKDVWQSTVPFLLMHYANDHLSPSQRIQAFADRFGQRVATIELPGDGHSSLAGDFHEQAYADAVTYLKVRLGAAPGPRAMHIARLLQRSCEITKDGLWRQVS